MSPEPTRPRRWLVVAGIAVGLIVLVGVSILVLRPAAPAATADRAAPATATITRETLVDVTSVSGQLAYGPEQLMVSRLTGTVTGVPAVGATIVRGKSLFRVDDKPVVLLYGTLPAYRGLTAGHAAVAASAGGAATDADTSAGGTDGAAVPASKGADVAQLERNLEALGYTGFTVDDEFTSSTAAAVRHWQRDLGMPETGDVPLGQVVYSTGPIRVAKLTLTLGSETSGPVLSYTGVARLVTAKVPEHNQELAQVSTKVTIALPSGKEVAGTVRSVASSADSELSDGQEPTLDVVVTLDAPATVNGLDDGPATVRFVAETHKDVLVVPVGALLALSEGGYGLQVIEGRTSRIVAVTTDLFADGKVEVSGAGIEAGLTVGMAR